MWTLPAKRVTAKVHCYYALFSIKTRKYITFDGLIYEAGYNPGSCLSNGDQLWDLVAAG
ncbi:hypothetical protein KSB_27910 [Ktedonobacter robiniae]|uniref:Uncharacterized protein n=1 Tax=Ktedonobacter robiniae TaxID=2778365 RepID=A0ABQ3UNR4_9CHLR|nr:hypothetical protein KSB_27910 [Ktedonobacter robiniae]